MTLFEYEETPDYKLGLERLGYEIIAWEDFGNYQGDYAAIVKGKGGFGFVVIGYGSCSGCDALEACDWPWFWENTIPANKIEKFEEANKKVQALFEDIERSIKWGSPSELTRFILSRERSGLCWYFHDNDFKTKRKALIKALLGNHDLTA